MNKHLKDLESLKVDEEMKKRVLGKIVTKQEKKYHKPVLLTGCIGALLLCALVFSFQLMKPISDEKPITLTKKVYSYVSIDINPSMEFKLDDNDHVVSVKAYNEDAELILKEVQVKSKKMEEALSLLLANENIQEYMNTGYMQVSVYSEDDKHSQFLEQELETTLSKHYNASQYGCSCSTKENHQAAQKHNLSFGKYEIIKAIMEFDVNYTYDSLILMNMQELQSLYEQLSGYPFSQNHDNKHQQGQENGHRGRGHHGRGGNSE